MLPLYKIPLKNQPGLTGTRISLSFGIPSIGFRESVRRQPAGSSQRDRLG